MTLTPSNVQEAAELPYADLWQDLLDKDDRTSPSDYPDMCLITYEEFLYYIRTAIAGALEGFKYHDAPDTWFAAALALRDAEIERLREEISQLRYVAQNGSYIFYSLGGS